MYNQPTTRLPNGNYIGTLYKNPIDCLWKTLKTEGPLALYKGGCFACRSIAPDSLFFHQDLPPISSGLHPIRMFTHHRIHGPR